MSIFEKFGFGKKNNNVESVGDVEKPDNVVSLDDFRKERLENNFDDESAEFRALEVYLRNVGLEVTDTELAIENIKKYISKEVDGGQEVKEVIEKVKKGIEDGTFYGEIATFMLSDELNEATLDGGMERKNDVEDNRSEKKANDDLAIGAGK